MNSITRSTLAIATALALTPSAHALSVSADGSGQVLLYPYYTVNGGNQTVLYVVNSTPRTKALMVRFREGRNSREVLKFNLYLAPYDAWTAAIAATAEAGPATLYSNDPSCTVPDVRQTSPSFRNYAYTGAFRDHPQSSAAQLSSLDRTREGHIEIIELGELQNGTGPTQLAEEVRPNSQGIPSNCASLLSAWSPSPPGPWTTAGQTNIDLPTGGLYGAASIVDVADGTMFAYNAVAIERFYTNASLPGELHRTSLFSDATNLTSADNGANSVRVSLPERGDRDALVETFPVGLPTPDAVSLALMQSSTQGEFNFDATIGANTEWIVSFPTKSHYTDVDGAVVVRPPFTDRFRDDGAACEEFYVDMQNRNGLRLRDPSDSRDTDIGLPPPQAPLPTLCGTVNVLSFGQPNATTTAILGARAARDFPYVSYFGSVGVTGMVDLTFDDYLTPAAEHELIAPTSQRRHIGLPAIALTVIRVTNANAQPGVLASYGGAYLNRAVRTSFDP